MDYPVFPPFFIYFYFTLVLREKEGGLFLFFPFLRVCPRGQ